jgi:hypothetical protein
LSYQSSEGIGINWQPFLAMNLTASDRAAPQYSGIKDKFRKKEVHGHTFESPQPKGEAHEPRKDILP